MNFNHHFFDAINNLYKTISIKLPFWQILNKKYKIFRKIKNCHAVDMKSAWQTLSNKINCLSVSIDSNEFVIEFTEF
ncbi:hypothetical protein SAMD00079811_23790 [Scytonema sp. HK-05]|nr:hypothetical protein SAMD00079811_23790 [Scytonema sp. HK-05]